MSKAKKQSKGNIILEIDKSLDKKYADMLEEIQYMQADIDRAERKAKKKALISYSPEPGSRRQMESLLKSVTRN